MTSPPSPSSDFRRALGQRLRSLAHAGVEQLPKPSPELLASLPASGGQTRSIKGATSDSEITMPRKRPAISPGTTSSAAAVSPSTTTVAGDLAPPIDSLPVLNRDERIGQLDALREDVAQCVRCAALASTRTQTVFGVGNPQPRLCFLGEAPGADEDRQGIPFVGRAGQLLTDIVEKGMKLSRDDVYILNVLKCRPPGNRNPLPDEATNCRGFLERQLEILRPEFICCLGAVAAQNLLATSVPVGKLRGKIHDWRGIKVVVTYHPSYLLRNPAAKKYTWEDIQLLMSEMES